MEERRNQKKRKLPKYVDPGQELFVEYHKDTPYKTWNGQTLVLQILAPENTGHRYPCIVYVQGSAWMKQDVYKKIPELSVLARCGYVIAIVQYRDSSMAHFPAPVEDTLDAIRFMQDRADVYPLDPGQLIVMGDSSGGHTAVMAGMTARTGRFGPACDVKGIIDLYGCVDPALKGGFPSTPDAGKITSPEGMEMGFDLIEEPERAQESVCRNYSSDLDVPILIVHGADDRTVSFKQSVQLYNALQDAGKDSELILIKRAQHGGAPFWSEAMIRRYVSFIGHCIERSQKA